MALSSNSSGSGSGSWWKPPGALDADAELSRLSFVSVASALAPSGRRRSSAVARATQLGAAVDQYLVTPSLESAGRLLHVARKPSVLMRFFSTHHSLLCLQLLDTLAEHILSISPLPPQSQTAPAAKEREESAVAATQQNVEADATLAPLLELVYLFSRRTAIGYPSHALNKLLQWLTVNISTTALQSNGDGSPMLKLQLVVLAEMIKASSGVQIFVKEMKKIKDFYRALTILLNGTEDAELLVFSMTILARLVLSDSLGNKLFSTKNVDQAFELVFSVLDGSWHGGDDAYSSDSVLTRPALLQLTGIDLLCDLAERSDVLDLLEKHGKIQPLLENFVLAVNLNASAEQIEVAVHFVTRVLALGHHFRKLVVKIVSDFDILYRVMQTTLHPSRLIAIMAVQLVLKVIGDDVRPMKSVFQDSGDVQRLTPVITGMFRCIIDVTELVQKRDGKEELCASEQYLHSMEGCQLLAKLCEFPAFRTACAQNISLNQSASLIQAESALIASIEPQELARFHPRLSLSLVALLSTFLGEDSLNEKLKRTLNQFLQSSEVSTVLGAGLFNSSDKEVVVDMLLLIDLCLSSSANKRFNAYSLAEGIINYGQRLSETTDKMESRIFGLEASSESTSKMIDKLQAQVQKLLHVQDELRTQHDQEMKELGAKFGEQMRQREEASARNRELYEAKIRDLNAQCESMAQHMNKKMAALQQRDQLLQETRTKRAVVEDENVELKRKVQVLEIRIEEIAQSHSIATEETRIRERELDALRDEMATVSGDYATKREELARVLEDNKALEEQLKEQQFANENTYKELVLLSKAHKVVADEKKVLEQELDRLRDDLAGAESLHRTVQSRLQEKKELVEKLEKKISFLEDAAGQNEAAIDEEREKRRGVVRDLDDLRKAHRKLESDIGMFEIRAAEQRLALDAKDEQLRKCEDEIRHLTNEVGKQVKLQALIHQLSSGGDMSASVASSFLARDS